MNQIQSDTIGKLAEALAKAQGKFKTAVKDKTNSHYKSPYASYEAVRDACQGALSAEGISVTHQLDHIEGKRAMITQLSHISGEWMRSYLALPTEKEGAQGIGSSITYAMRYSLSSMLCIPNGDGDDDGEVAQAPYREIETKAIETQKKIHSGQAAYLIKKIGDNQELLKNILKTYGIQEIGDLPEKHFSLVEKMVAK